MAIPQKFKGWVVFAVPFYNETTEKAKKTRHSFKKKAGLKICLLSLNTFFKTVC